MKNQLPATQINLGNISPDLRKQLFDQNLSLILLIVIFALSGCSSQEKNNLERTQDSVPSTTGMVLIPGGTYLMGGKSDQAEQDEFPRHEVSVSAFYLDETEVTNEQFEKFVEATGYKTIAERPLDWEEIKMQVPPGTPKPPDEVLQPGSLVFQPTDGPVNLQDVSQWWFWTVGADWRHPDGPQSSIEGKMDHPVVHIAYDDALAYAEWAGKRLPTEAEWEWASMGGLDDPKYPWGDESVEEASAKANFWQGIFPFRNLETDGYYRTAPVKSFEANGYGLYDMAGNVWEWCQDKYHHDAYKEENIVSSIDPKGPRNSFDPTDPYADKYVVRGGSYLCSDSYCSGYRVSRRMRTNRDTGLGHTGFRCARDVEL